MVTELNDAIAVARNNKSNRFVKITKPNKPKYARTIK